MGNVPLWPVAAAAQAGETDLLYLGLILVTGLTAGLVFVLLIVFSIKYRATSAADRSDRVKKSWYWEIGWTVASFVVFLGLFVWGADLYVRLFQAPADAVDVFVVGKRWMWKVQHQGGQREIDELHVPVGQAIRLVMTSQDVIHSFYVPAFRVKHDVLPGRYEDLWFTPTRVGEYHLECSEFCGTDHAQMAGQVVVMSPTAFQTWLEQNQPKLSLAQQGAHLFSSLGCASCHAGPSSSPSSQKGTAPVAAMPVGAMPVGAMYGRLVPLPSGRMVIADTHYLHDAILKVSAAGSLCRPPSELPQAAGMPSYAGSIDEEDLVKLVAYLESVGTIGQGVKDQAAEAPAGKDRGRL